MTVNSLNLGQFLFKTLDVCTILFAFTGLLRKESSFSKLYLPGGSTSWSVRICNGIALCLCFIMSCNADNKGTLSQYKRHNHCINLKFTLEHPMKAQRGSRGIAVLSLILALVGAGGQQHAPATLPAVKRPGTIPCTGGWVGAQ